MQADLDTLENKLAQLIQLSQRLRSENHQLRQDLAHTHSQIRHQQDQIDQAKTRLERLITQLPEDTAP